MLLKEVFNRGVKLFPNKVALVDGTRRFTYKDWGARQNRLANALIHAGVGKGDRVGVLLKNCAEVFDVFAAGAKTGAVVVPINFRLNPEALQTLLANAGCRVLLVGDEFGDTINKLKSRMPFIETYICVGGEADGMLEYESMLEKASPVEPDVVTAENDPAVIIYTSGTTGVPKGAVATRKTTLARLCQIAIEMGIEPDDRNLCVLPLFHIGGNMVSLGFVFRGATNVIQKDWDTQEFCRIAQEEKITKTLLTPVIVNFIANWPQAARYDFGHLRLLQYGGSPMPMETLRKAMGLLPACKFQQGYGSSECFSAVILRPEEHAAALGGSAASIHRMGSCGRQGILSKARVVKDDGTDVLPGEVGEIVLGGAMLMSGYWNNPEESAKTLKDGWCYTRDLAMVDEEGYIYIVDRKNRMIITGGENVYPAQVENILFEHPNIEEAAVLGVPDDTWGEAVKAVVVVKPGETLTQRDVIDFCTPRMANYARPKYVEFADVLPHTATGKIDMVALKDKFCTADKGEMNHEKFA